MCYWFIPLIAAGVSAAGQAQAGAESDAAAQRSALLGEAQANDAEARGNVEEERFRRQLAQVAGSQRAAIGARNLQRSGTALDLLTDTQMLGDEDALTIQNDAAREAWGYRQQADESRRWGKATKRNAGWSAGSTLLTGGAQAYGQWQAA